MFFCVDISLIHKMLKPVSNKCVVEETEYCVFVVSDTHVHCEWSARH